MVQKLKVKNSVSYGTGMYDRQAHAPGSTATAHKKWDGVQKAVAPTAGTEKGATKMASGAIARDGVEGHAGPKRGYQTDAHTGLHHGKHGFAVGHKADLHMDYDKELYSEGRPLSENNPGWVRPADHNNTTKAQHHPSPTGSNHTFNTINTGHDYGYRGEQRKGALRMSGHAGAHQVGCRTK